MLGIAIKKLIQYGLDKGLMKKEDVIYVRNLLLAILEEDSYEDTKEECKKFELEEILKELCGIAFKKGIIPDMSVTACDLFDTKIMNCLMPRPSEVIAEFYDKYQKSEREATDYFYSLSCDSNYIRRDRIIKDIKWTTETEYGTLDITINLAKPEKDPKAIAAAQNAAAVDYPRCLLCKENEGYAGRINHPARQNHRIIPITLQEKTWYFQYSPYVYYNEHCIAFSEDHIPMKIDKNTFIKLLDFIKLFPHYFIGSNADLPIVGGSILSHEHFQGGNYTFAMAKAEIEKYYTLSGFEDVEAGILHWPLSVIRIRSKDAGRLAGCADFILKRWKNYTDEDSFIYAETGREPHNTITPIARMADGVFELDLTLRNNITTEENPLGVFHPHGNLHHIKRENIGLIEVMGLAVLPSRLKEEMELLREYILEGRDIKGNGKIEKHEAWVNKIKRKYKSFNENNIDAILKEEVGLVFMQVLEDAGVFKCNREGRAAFDKFMKQGLQAT